MQYDGYNTDDLYYDKRHFWARVEETWSLWG